MAEIRAVAQEPDPAPAAFNARLLLNDLSPDGMGLFSSQPLAVEQEVTVTLSEPAKIQFRGKVVYCQEFDKNSHVISGERYTFRMGIEFKFATPEEEAAAKKYCEDITQGLSVA